MHRNHVWSYDFVEAQTHDGRRIHGKTAIASPSMASCATSASTRKSSTVLRKHRPLSSNGAITTTRYARTRRSHIGLLHRRHPQALQSIWIAITLRSGLYPPGLSVRSVWGQGNVKSWYKNAAGRVFSISPWSLFDHWQWMSNFNKNNFVWKK
jgi:hypothetical protein